MICLGFISVTIFIWFRFLRKRIPRALPLTLFVIIFVLIICSTTLYIYIFYRLFKPSKKENKIIQELSTLLYAPLDDFDSFVKLYIFLDDILLYFYNNIENIDRFYFFTNILPRIITCAVLFMDVFIWFKFQYIYSIIFITLIPLVTRYYIYSLKKLLDCKIITLSTEFAFVSTGYVYGIHPDEWPENQSENDEDDDLILDFSDTMNLPLEIFIPYETKCMVYNKKKPDYFIFFGSNLYKKYSTDNIIKKKNLEIKQSIEELLKMSVFVLTYKNILLENKLLRNLKAVIYGIYITCWCYIIFYTAPKVLWFTASTSLHHTLFIMEDPFSGQLMPYEIYEYLKISL